MSKMDDEYCRLCAELKPKTKLLNLQSDDRKRTDIIEKLSRLNAGADFDEQVLPKTVCFVCISSLDKAFQFVLGIEQAQAVLSDLLLVQQIKKESSGPERNCDSDVENFSYEPANDVDMIVKQELSMEDDVKPNVSKLKKKRCSPKSLDTIPLSQLKLTWKDYDWVCSMCETQFPTVEELKSHSIQYHDCCNAFRCTDCNKRKLRIDSFVQHVKRHRNYLKLSCYICHARFSKPHESNQHKNAHLTSEHVCTGCNSSFSTAEELLKHSTEYNKDKRARRIPILDRISSNLTCVLCKKQYKNKSSLNTHLLTHTDRKRDHTCEICGKCFFSKQNLAGHMLLHDDKRPFQCKICKFGFKTSGQLRSHVGVHDTKKPYACDQCGRAFRLKKQLQSHSIIHTDLLPYICTYCNKRFRFKTILNQHIRQHTGVKPYACELCQRDFTNWPNYNKHMKRRHGMDMSKKKRTPDGVYPINPITGEMVMFSETDEEWRRQMMVQRRPGRPKLEKMGTKMEYEKEEPISVESHTQ